MAWASVSDVVARLGTPVEEGRVKAMIEDAEALITAELEGVGKTTADVDASRLKACVCAMVCRAAGAGDVAGITQTSEAVGPFTRSLTYAQPLGELYVGKSERKLLGLGGVRIGSYVAARDTHVPD